SGENPSGWIARRSHESQALPINGNPSAAATASSPSSSPTTPRAWISARTRRSASKAASAVHPAQGKQASSASTPGRKLRPSTSGSAQGSCAQISRRTTDEGSRSTNTAPSSNGTSTSGESESNTAGTRGSPNS